jgi:NADPH2:quinone reductase
VRAVTIVDRHLHWVERPDPRPGANELLIAVKAAGVNGADIKSRQRPNPPAVPGLELAGEVVEIGPAVTRFEVGQKVMALAANAHAEQAVVHELLAMAVPEPLSWAEAGGFPEMFAAAHDALFTQCGLTVGERVLVHGAAGGVGIAGVQLAAVAGAQVVATVRHPKARAVVADLLASTGLVHVVAPDDYVHRGPFDVVLEMVGASNMMSNVHALATGGRISVIGTSAGASAEVDLTALLDALKSRRGRIHASVLRQSHESPGGIPADPSRTAAAEAVRAVDHRVVPLLEAGRVCVPIAAEYPMADADAAYDSFAAGGKVGKIVLMT